MKRVAPARETKVTILMTTDSTEGENMIPFVAIVADLPRLQQRIDFVRSIHKRDAPMETRAACLNFWSDEVVYVEWLSDLSSELRKIIGKKKTARLESGERVIVKDDLTNDLANDAARIEACMVEFWDVCFGVSGYSKYSGARYEGSRSIHFATDLPELFETSKENRKTKKRGS